jgi:acylphosphatase
MAIKRIHVRVSGRVQGVFFRACTREEAQNLGLCGWVRNMPDGSVEAEMQGDELALERMVAWLQRGSPLSLVHDVVVTPRDVTERAHGFDIT